MYGVVINYADSIKLEREREETMLLIYDGNLEHVAHP